MGEREQYTDRQRPHRRERYVRSPTGELSHEQLLRRQRGHVRILTLVLLAVLAMLAYAAAFDLNHWPEWIVFGGICAVAVGVMIAVHAR
jgi:hypothetical protein